MVLSLQNHFRNFLSRLLSLYFIGFPNIDLALAERPCGDLLYVSQISETIEQALILFHDSLGL